MGKNKQMQYDAKGAGTRLRQMRRVLGKTQAEIAALLQISLSHYSKLELGIGRMSRSMIFSVCNKFALNEKWLTDGAGTMWADPAAAGEIRDTADAYGPSGRCGGGADLADIERILALAQCPKNQKLADQMAAALGIPKEKSLAVVVRTALAAEKAGS